MFPEFLRRHLANDLDVKARSLWKVVYRYKRQYFGLVENGRRVIASNFFCVVTDGGVCFLKSRTT